MGTNTRRDFTKLLALAPLALSLRPSKPEPFELRCRDCGGFVGSVSWPMKVDKEGLTLCVDHASRHPSHEPGKSLITDYHFGIYSDGWDEYRKQSIVGHEKIAQEIVERLRREGHLPV